MVTPLLNYPPIVAFLDERIERRDSLARWIIGCCVFGRDRWIAYDRKARKLRQSLKDFDELLSAIGGAAVLGYADVPNELMRTGDIDGTADIPRMSRTDNIWSQLALFSLFTVFAWLQRSKVDTGTVDFYYDPKDLKGAHRTQFEDILRKRLPEIAKDTETKYADLFPGDASRLRFRAIESVTKPLSGQPWSAFQRGTNLADYLCKQSPALIERGSKGNLLVRDLTAHVLATVSKFTISIDEPRFTGDV